MSHLSADTELTTKQVAEKVGIHPRRAAVVLNGMLRDGLVERGRHVSGKPGMPSSSWWLPW